MLAQHKSCILVENFLIPSSFLDREVRFDIYRPEAAAGQLAARSLLLINDGQNREELGLATILEQLSAAKEILLPTCVAIHAGLHRKMEYGIALQADYKGRGARAGAYTSFILQELLPLVQEKFPSLAGGEKWFAGFSLGGLSALDIVWNHPDVFCGAAVFSGSLWWRSIPQEDKHYDDDRHRIMHQQIRNGKFNPGLKFFLQCGHHDETKDRNQNGIIDSVEDTLDLVKELQLKGYRLKEDIYYLELKEGRHDIKTWAAAMPYFLKWAFGHPEPA
jgi:enterochelin esterase-like enzyme